MNPVSSKKSRSPDVPQSVDFSSDAVSWVSARTEDGRSVDMKVGDSHYQLSARQADAIAQGLLMSLLRTDLDIANMPWDGGCHLNVSSHNGDRAALRFPDDTLYQPNATFRYFGMCWLYEGTGEDPDYPANVLCIRTLHDGGILFGKGSDEYLLTAEQALQLCRSLSDCAYSLEIRSWRIWDKMIEWRPRADSYMGAQTPEETALFNYLSSYKRRRKSKHNSR